MLRCSTGGWWGIPSNGKRSKPTEISPTETKRGQIMETTWEGEPTQILIRKSQRGPAGYLGQCSGGAMPAQQSSWGQWTASALDDWLYAQIGLKTTQTCPQSNGYIQISYRFTSSPHANLQKKSPPRGNRLRRLLCSPMPNRLYHIYIYIYISFEELIHARLKMTKRCLFKQVLQI